MLHADISKLRSLAFFRMMEMEAAFMPNMIIPYVKYDLWHGERSARLYLLLFRRATEISN